MPHIAQTCTRVYVTSNKGPDFWLYFYGLTPSDLLTVPNQYIAAAIRKRGLFPEAGYMSSPFWVEGIRPRWSNAIMYSMVEAHHR
jgi:hypothetical protein